MSQHDHTANNNPQQPQPAPQPATATRQDVPPEAMPLLRRLRREILAARQHVYRAGQPTPLQKMPLPEGYAKDGGQIWVKREDLSPIKAYKWRGSFNKMAQLSVQEREQGVVTASAGNHAQGVALAAATLGIRATIFMPRTTPGIKREAVERLGRDKVEIILTGDGYDDALAAAKEHEKKTGATYVHAFDDLLIVAGQGTLADEIVMSGEGPFDIAYLQIGGGGMIAGVAAWLKTYWPAIRIVGVEGAGQASMKAALAAGERISLPKVDIFCDGTAVRQTGEIAFDVVRELVDEIITVSNEEVCAAIALMWDSLRCISEPSGAMGLAAAIKDGAAANGARVLTVLTGANVDFGQIAMIASRAASGGLGRMHLTVQIPEIKGSMLGLLDKVLSGVSIVDFQYGKSDNAQAWPLFELGGTEAQLQQVRERLDTCGYRWQEVTDRDQSAFRFIPLHTPLLSHPVLLSLEFYERPGALHDFMSRTLRDKASFCYFNYRYSGERVGRALIGLDFDSEAQAQQFLAELPPKGEGYRSCQRYQGQL